MTIPLFSVPLRPPTLMELEDNHRTAEAAGYFTPMAVAKREIQEAVTEVRDAQYSTGKGIWEDR